MANFTSFEDAMKYMYPKSNNYVENIKEYVCKHIHTPLVVEKPKKEDISYKKKSKKKKLEETPILKKPWMVSARVYKNNKGFEIKANFNIENKVNTILKQALYKEGFKIEKTEYHDFSKKNYSLITKKNDENIEVIVMAKEKPKYYEVLFYKTN